jgi:signal transduction histidine kinase
MGTRVNYSGLVVAGVGFFLTRFTVTLAVYQTPVRFYLAGVVPLVLGLGLAAFGVALTVADVEASLVRTTARWCVAGTAAMLVLVVLTLLGSSAGEMPAFESARSRTYLSNFLIGGSVGGTLTGLYAARTRRHRGLLRQQRNRLEVLNRLLRHEVINSVSVIRGYAGPHGEGDSRAGEVIEDHSAAIEDTIEDVKYLTRSAGSASTATRPVDLRTCVREGIEPVTDAHPEADVVVDVPEGLQVRANERLAQAVARLVENAVEYGPDAAPSVVVSGQATGGTVRLSVSDEGSGLPAAQRALLESGTIDEFDDPEAGFGLNVVRLVVESFDGSIETTVTDEGTTVTVVLPRADSGGGLGAVSGGAGLAGVRPALPHLLVVFGAALVAGAAYGVVAEAMGGSVAFIGVYYGTQHPVVGWLTHEFHSVVFGFVFAGLVTLAPARYRGDVPAYVAVGVAWGAVLWLVAAGLVSPVWLRLLDVPASIPSLSTTILVTHLVWGATLGALTAAGYRRLAG